MSSPVALKVAGQVFERLRANGQPLEAAMREAERTLNAAREAARVPSEAAGPVPSFAREVLEKIAHHYRVTVEAMQFRGGAKILAAVRDEAAYVLLRAGLSHTQVGRLMRRDRYAAIASERRFAAGLKLAPASMARIEQAIAEALALKAYRQAPPPRRPAVRAPIAPAASTVEGGA